MLNHVPSVFSPRRPSGAGCFLLLLLLGVAGNIAAQNYYYSPNSLYFAVLRQKHDFNLRASISGNRFDSGLEFSAAYTPGYNFFVAVNRTHLEEGDALTRTVDLTLNEAALGFYRNSGNVNISLSAGYGLADIVNHYQSSIRSDLAFSRAFLQLNTCTVNKKWRYGAGIRLTQIAYGKGIYDPRIDMNQLAQLEIIAKTSRFTTLEAGLMFGYNLRCLSITLSTVNVVANESALNFNTNHTNLSLYFDVHELWRPRVPAAPEGKPGWVR